MSTENYLYSSYNHGFASAMSGNKRLISEQTSADPKKRRLNSGLSAINTSFSSFSTEPNTPQFRPGCTVPQPFNFLTDQRLRGSQCVSTEERELQEIQQRPKFKARPVPKFGNPIVQFPKNDFRASKSVDYGRGNLGRKSYKEILQQPDFVPVFNRSYTLPQEFNFATSQRARKTVSCSPKRQFKARPMPDFSKPFNVIKEQSNRTHPNNINSQESRGRSRNPPYHFTENQQNAFTSLQQTTFQARPMPNFQNPFQPMHSPKYTIPQEFELNSSARKQQRELFNEVLRAKERKLEQQQQIEQMEYEAQQQQELAFLRQRMEFRAREMPDFNIQCFKVQKSAMDLTVPVSPKLGRHFSRLSNSENKDPNMIQDSDDMDIDYELCY